MLQYSSFRGVSRVALAAPDANQILAQLQSSLEDFRAKHDSRVAAMETQIDELNANITNMRVGGAVGWEGDGNTLAAARRAITNLGEFGRTGSAEALVRGLNVNNAARSSDGPSGGFTVPEELSTELMKLQRNDSAMRRLARVVSTNSQSFKQPISSGATASGWVGETTARPETTALALRAVEIFAGEIYANPAITQNLLDDSAYDLGTFIASEISDEFNSQEGAAFITGNGINKPLGLLSGPTPVTTADATRAGGTLQYIPTGAASSFAASSQIDALQDMVFRTKAKYRQNGYWLMNSTTLATISKFKDGSGNYIWQRAVANGVPSMLLGYPVEIDEDMPDVGAGTFPVAFGDFKRGYMIADRFGVRILRDDLTNKPYVHFYATKRVGGALLDTNALKLLKVAAS